MNSPADFQPQPSQPSPGIVLTVTGLGTIFSFKNKKRIGGLTRWPDGIWRGNPVLITRKDVKKQMDQIVSVLKYQLSSASVTNADGTQTECCQPYSIVLFEPCASFDDNWQQIEIGYVKTELVPKGQEGCTITIERLT